MDSFLNTLFPNDPAYAGLLSVERVRQLQQQSLLRAGLGMLGDTTGPQPMATGPALAKNLGGQLQNFPEQMSGAAESAARMLAFQKQQDVLKTRRGILDLFPGRDGETPEETGGRLMKMLPYFMRAGDMDMVTRMTELLKSMKFGDTGTEHYNHGVHTDPITHKVINPDEQYRIGKNGQPEWLGISQPVDQNAKDALALNHEVTRATPIMNDYRAETKDFRTAHTYGRQALDQADAALAGDPAAQYTVFHGFLKLNDPQAVVRPGSAEILKHAMSLYQRASAFVQSYLDGKSGLMDPTFTRQVIRVVAEQTRDIERLHGDAYNEALRRLDLAKLSHDWIAPADSVAPGVLDRWAPQATRARSDACAHDITKC